MINWIVSVSAFSLLITIISFILPTGKIKPFILSILSILGVFVVISPISNINYNANFNTSLDVFNYEEVAPQQNYLNYVLKEKKQNYEKYCASYLEEKGIKNATVFVNLHLTEDYNFFINKIEVNLKNSVIISNKEHIDIIEEIKQAFIKNFNLNSKQIYFIE
ncbi:MAG: stage III sporulation protein AF [Clostridia bacterium]|nr:stage III sporulation protein AF [Clostridia bacterium]